MVPNTTMNSVTVEFGRSGVGLRKSVRSPTRHPAQKQSPRKSSSSARNSE
jgi:hypothetical protein